jgi:hypothetical protein
MSCTGILRTDTEYDSVFAAAFGRGKVTVLVTGAGIPGFAVAKPSARMCPADGGGTGAVLHPASISPATSAGAKAGIMNGRKRVPDLMGALDLA